MRFTPQDEEFRAEVRAWLEANLTGEFASLRGAGGPGREHERYEERLAWNRHLAAAGWTALGWPKEFGGRDATLAQQVIFHEEYARAGAPARVTIVGEELLGPTLIAFGTPGQKARFLPPIRNVTELWCQGYSEPGAGSDLASVATKATLVKGEGEVGGDWVITGQKIWTSLAREASWAICIARTDPAAPRHDGISYFLLDMHSPGVQVRPLREITGDALFNQVFLDSVFVPDDCLVGEVNGGWKIARTTLANERVSLSQSWTFGSGVPELIEVAKAAGRPPLADVGGLVSEGRAIDVLGLRATLKRLSGTEPGATGSVRKLLGMRHSQQVSELCWAMSGSSGALGATGGPPVGPDGQPNGAQWARQVLLTRALTIGGGTTDVQLNIIAERMLGLPRDPEPPVP